MPAALLGNHVLNLFFSSYEQYLLARTGNLLQCLGGLVNLCHRLVEVDDVDSVTLGVDVGSHCGVPLTVQVAKVASGLQQHIKVCS